MLNQPSLFDESPMEPEGLKVQAGFISVDEERTLLAEVSQLEVRPFEFGPFLGLRRVTSFGRRYDFSDHRLKEAPEFPEWLELVRRRAEALSGARLEQALITEYRPGAGIGWHKDRPQFGRVVGISLAAPCTFRFRRRLPGGGFERAQFTAEPRSAYLLDGPARSVWEHSIPPLGSLRWSITLRELR